MSNNQNSNVAMQVNARPNRVSPDVREVLQMLSALEARANQPAGLV